MLSSGPPELPRLIAASVWMKSTYGPGVDVAGLGRDDAAGDGAAEAERVADGDHVLADAHRVAVAERQLRQAAGVDLDEREVGLLVGADHLGVELAVVGDLAPSGSSASSTTWLLVTM